MHIKVIRFHSDDDATLSLVSVDHKFQCFGIEDEYREEKVINETRIPAGIYKIGVRTVGGFHARYSKKFPNFHRGMLEILDVPHFTYVLIHVGNTDDDTGGCLVVGNIAYTEPEIKNGQSAVAYKNLYRKVIDAALAGNLTIEYVDADRDMVVTRGLTINYIDQSPT